MQAGQELLRKREFDLFSRRFQVLVQDRNSRNKTDHYIHSRNFNIDLTKLSFFYGQSEHTT